MQSSIPTEITPYLTDAIPILHRTLLRMGSFPYQNNPDPEKLLVLETLRTACILFSREPEDLAGNSDLLIIMFQSMAGLGPRRAQEDGRPRDEDDDDHLKQALWMVRNRARDPNNPRVMISGPENPPPSHFPSSWSKDFDQSIPTGDFRSFLRLMTVLNLYHGGANVSNLSVQQIEEVTSCMLAAFQPSTAGITWNNFSQVIENHMVSLQCYCHTLSIIAHSNSQFYSGVFIYYWIHLHRLSLFPRRTLYQQMTCGQSSNKYLLNPPTSGKYPLLPTS